MSNFVRYRWWWLAGTIASLIWLATIQANQPDAQTCQTIQNVNQQLGDTTPACPAPASLHWAIAAAVIFGLMFLVAMLARRQPDSTND